MTKNNLKKINIYIKSEIWRDDPFLVQPEDTTKRCPVCGTVRYSIDFPNAPEYVDQKLPVCLSCYRAKNDNGRNIVIASGAVRVCKKCGVEKTLADFSYRKRDNAIMETCRECGRERWNK